MAAETDTVQTAMNAMMADKNITTVTPNDDTTVSSGVNTWTDLPKGPNAKFGARLAFDDYRKMLAHPDIDAVAISLRVPSHYEPAMAALNAGKHVYTEWPLGQSTAEAQEITATNGPGRRLNGLFVS